MKKYKVLKDSMEVVANGHSVNDTAYLVSKIDYINGDPREIAEFDTADKAIRAAEKYAASHKMRAPYEFTAGGSARIAYEYITVHEYEDDEFTGNIFAELVKE